ncbi:MAG: sulfite exporter TauE/SafE family protein [Planctomycetes bacterium]|nr:sulfite exporter TauE/SafE family protein [Planctomycetota bacterium]
MLIVLLGALAIGVSLGLMGSGGSILTVPILHYLLDQEEKVAITGSLLVVGSIALVGSLLNVARGQVHWRSVFWFGLPGMAGTWFGALLSKLASGTFQLALFDAVMLTAGVFMLRPPRLDSGPHKEKARWKIVIDGLLVGALTGFVGVGGGFMIVPALALLGGLSMRLAVGTSLIIIAANSVSGFARHFQNLRELHLELDFHVLGWFVGAGVVGSLLGGLVSNKVPQGTLQRGFGGLLLLAGLAILGALLFG